jgi:hypothetical protein
MDIPKYNILGISFIVRLLVMLVIYYLPIENTIKIILLFCADFLDCWTTKLIGQFKYNIPFFDNHWCKEFSYQMTDKLLDIFSYMLVIHLLPDSSLLLGLIIYRLLGIGLFYKTRDSGWLILFPDLFKEVVIYNLLFGSMTANIFLLIIVGKIVFEIIWHRHVNKNHYKRRVQQQ